MPNAGHRALAALERHVDALALATQNVDDLHERGGSSSPLHLHGRILFSRCFADCGRDTPEDPTAPAPRCACGAFLRPDVVWFGEILPTDLFEAAGDAATACEACLVVGTSGLVYPAAGLPQVARHAGAVLIEVNLEETAISSDCDLCLRGPAAEMLPRLLQELGFSGEPARKTGV
jgi:NAD-dependent deacetylase